jgi:hypothetical protein
VLGLALSKGHHIMPQSLYDGVKQELVKIFNDPKNRICHEDYKDHNRKSYNGISEGKYRAAVNEVVDEFLNGRSLNDLTPPEAQELFNKIKKSKKTNIKTYLAGVRAEMKCCIAEAKANRNIVDKPAQPAQPAGDGHGGKSPRVRGTGGLGRTMGITGIIFDILPFVIQSNRDHNEAKRRVAEDPSKTYSEHLYDIGKEQVEEEKRNRTHMLMGPSLEIR